MKNFWIKYKSKFQKKDKTTILDDISISNDNVKLLNQRLDFFLPNFKQAVPYPNRIIYIFAWSLFSTSLFVPSTIKTFNDFLFSFSREFVLVSLIVWLSLAIIDVLRPRLKNVSIWYACVRVLLITTVISALTMLFVSLLWSMFKEQSFSLHDISYEIVIHSFVTIIATISALMFFLNRYHETLLLTEAFELKIAAQNEISNARMSPHFFFNTMNGLTSLVESDPEKAVTMLGNIATLFRASFDDAAEISLEEEVDLCKVFLVIDEMRFHGKLEISWHLPDEEMMYDIDITSLTLQSMLEKLLHHVVEMTTESIHVDIAIAWENHKVDIIIKVMLPRKTLLVRYDLNQQMNFDIQAQRLKYHFGAESEISTQILEHQIVVTITYPLHDPTLSLGTIDSAKVERENARLNTGSEF